MLWSVIRLIFKTSSVTPDFFYVCNLILSFSTCSQSFKKICGWELLGANVLKSVWTSASTNTATSRPNKEYWLIQKQTILLSILLTSCFFFSGGKHFLTSLGLWCFLSSLLSDISPRGQHDFSEVFAEGVVGIQILREQDSI